MDKYRVLTSYQKQITNAGRLITLKPGAKVYLKKEPQVLRLIQLGYIKPIVELRKKQAKVKQAPKKEAPEEIQVHKQAKQSKKSEYINKKNKNKADNQSS